MRVTRAIKEYVEQYIFQKYDEKKADVQKSYYEEKEALNKEIDQIAEEANERAKQLCRSRGFDVGNDYRGHELIYSAHNAKKEEIESLANDERRLIDNKKHAKAKQVLFDLEIGSTGKDELMEVLNGIEID